MPIPAASISDESLALIQEEQLQAHLEWESNAGPSFDDDGDDPAEDLDEWLRNRGRD